MSLPSEGFQVGKWKEQGRRLAIAGSGWLFLTLLITTQNYILFNGSEREAPWLYLFYREFPVWLSCWILSPLVGILSRRFPVVPGVRLRHLALHLPFGALFALVSVTMFTFMRNLVGIRSRLPKPFLEVVAESFVGSFAIGLIIYGMIAGAYHGLRYYRAYRQRELAASRLEARLAEARLDALRMQLHPHFLFNTLHAVSGLMSRDVQGARRMIARLSDLLRLSLEQDAAQETRLEEEIVFLRHYIEIQMMRFGDRLSVTTDIPSDTFDLLVPRLLLQPLVENSIRHGVSRLARPGRVSIAARRAGGRLTIVVEDNGPGLGPAPVREGVGIGNTRARLRHLYGDEHRFELEDISTDDMTGARAVIEIPAHESSAPDRERSLS